MQVTILDDYQDAVKTLDCFSKLREHTVTIYNDTVRDIEPLVKRLSQTEALVLIRERTAITAPLLDRLPNLKLISQTGRGVAHIDVEACTRRGIAVAVGEGSPYATAELTWGLILAATRQIVHEAAYLLTGGWQSVLGRGLRGRTLGIFGYGKIGSVVADYGRAFGMNVVIWGRQGSLSRAQSVGFSCATSQRDLFERADVLSLHIKLIPETRGIVTSSDLAAMQSSSLIVNTSRAELIESGALEHALQNGHPGNAAVDVYESEPVIDHPLLHLNQALCTPHLGYVEKDSYELYFGAAFDHILAFALSTPRNLTNLEVLNSRNDAGACDAL